MQRGPPAHGHTAAERAQLKTQGRAKTCTFFTFSSPMTHPLPALWWRYDNYFRLTPTRCGMVWDICAGQCTARCGKQECLSPAARNKASAYMHVRASHSPPPPAPLPGGRGFGGHANSTQRKHLGGASDCLQQPAIKLQLQMCTHACTKHHCVCMLFGEEGRVCGQLAVTIAASRSVHTDHACMAACEGGGGKRGGGGFHQCVPRGGRREL